MEVVPSPDAWRGQCEALLEGVLECEDSGPFRTAVDPVEYPVGTYSIKILSK